MSEITQVAQENVKRSALSYEVALDVAARCESYTSDVKSLKKRLGNVQNELGVQYMNLSASLLNEEGEEYVQNT